MLSCFANLKWCRLNRCAINPFQSKMDGTPFVVDLLKTRYIELVDHTYFYIYQTTTSVFSSAGSV